MNIGGRHNTVGGKVKAALKAMTIAIFSVCVCGDDD